MEPRRYSIFYCLIEDREYARFLLESTKADLFDNWPFEVIGWLLIGCKRERLWSPLGCPRFAYCIPVTQLFPNSKLKHSGRKQLPSWIQILSWPSYSSLWRHTQPVLAQPSTELLSKHLYGVVSSSLHPSKSIEPLAVLQETLEVCMTWGLLVALYKRTSWTYSEKNLC